MLILSLLINTIRKIVSLLGRNASLNQCCRNLANKIISSMHTVVVKGIFIHTVVAGILVIHELLF